MQLQNFLFLRSRIILPLFHYRTYRHGQTPNRTKENVEETAAVFRTENNNEKSSTSDEGSNVNVREIQISNQSMTKIEIDPAVHRENMRRQPERHDDTKILHVSIIGKPNVGKSALMNAITGATVSAVSSKIHTTRKVTSGILVNDKTQIIFRDTPGFVQRSKIPKKYKIEPSLLKDHEFSLKSSEMILVLHDVSNEFACFRLDMKIFHILYRYRHLPSILVLNKIDALKTKSKILDMIYTLTKGRVNEQLLTRRKTKVLRLAEEEEQSKKLAELVAAYKQKRLAGDLATIEEPKSFGESSETYSSSADQSKTSGKELEKYDEENEDKSKTETENQGEFVEDHRELFKFDKSLWNVDWETLEKITKKPLHEVPSQQLRKCFLHERGWPYFKAVFTVSAKHGFGIDKLAEFLISNAKPGDWRYHSSLKTPMNPYQLATEVIRSKIYERVPYEIPYHLSYRV